MCPSTERSKEHKGSYKKLTSILVAVPVLIFTCWLHLLVISKHYLQIATLFSDIPFPPALSYNGQSEFPGKYSRFLEHTAPGDEAEPERRRAEGKTLSHTEPGESCGGVAELRWKGKVSKSVSQSVS